MQTPCFISRDDSRLITDTILQFLRRHNMRV